MTGDINMDGNKARFTGDDLMHFARNIKGWYLYADADFQAPFGDTYMPKTEEERINRRMQLDAMAFARDNLGIVDLPLHLPYRAKRMGVQYDRMENDIDTGMMYLVAPRIEVNEDATDRPMYDRDHIARLTDLTFNEQTQRLEPRIVALGRHLICRRGDFWRFPQAENPTVQKFRLALDESDFVHQDQVIRVPRVGVVYGAYPLATNDIHFKAYKDVLDVPNKRALQYVERAIGQIETLQSGMREDTPLMLAGPEKTTTIRGGHILPMLGYAKEDLAALRKAYL